MNYAPVVPPYYVKFLPPTEASFCYATIAIKNEKYREYFADKPNLVMDNPVYERNGEFVSPEDLRYLIKYLKPTFAFMPDVINDSKATLAQAGRYMGYIGDPCLAAVPQGKTLEGLLECAKEFYDWGIRRFGVSIIPVRELPISRIALTEVLINRTGNDCFFHWLGADFPYEEERIYKNPQVLTCDSAEAFNAASRAVSLSIAEKNDTRRPKDFMSMKSGVDKKLLQANVNLVAKWFR